MSGERHDVDAYILAGGDSRRMGQPKARLEVDGDALAVRLAARLATCVDHVWLVAKPNSGLEDLGLPMLYDATGEPALVHGLGTALAAPGPPWRFVTSCDMPEVDAAILAALTVTATRSRTWGAVPRLAGRTAPEPLPSLWHIDVLRCDVGGWGLAARDWVRHAGLAIWDVAREEENWFVHVNTPDEFAAWQQRRAGAARPPRS